MQKRERLFRPALSALCAVFVCSVLVLSSGCERQGADVKQPPKGEAKVASDPHPSAEARAASEPASGSAPVAAMEDEQFVELCEQGTAEQVRSALKNGASPEARKYFDWGSMPVLTLAAQAGKLPVVQALLEALREQGASVDAADADVGVTALMAAARAGHAAVVEALLAAGASTERKDIDGHDALWYAQNAGEEVSSEAREACVKLLQGDAKKQAKAMPDAEFAELCRNGSAEQVKQALAGGANPKARDDEHVPALVGAAFRNDVSVIRALLDAGADVNAGDRGGYTALMAAAFSNGAPVVQALLAAGAKVNAQDNTDVSALMLAAGRGHHEITALLLKAGADKALKDAVGNDALRYAQNAGKEVSEEAKAACIKLLQGAGKEDGAIRFLREVRENMYDDAWMLAHTSSAIQKAAKDAYDYECAREACYGWWILRTTSQEGEDLLGIEGAGEGWYVVRLRRGDGDVAIRTRVVRDGSSYKVTGLVNPDWKIEVR